MRGFALAATMALSLTLLTPARAQHAHAMEGGFLTAFEDAVFQIGYRSTGLKPGGARLDFSIASMPEGWTESIFLLLAHLDLTAGVAVGPRAWLLPRAGVSLLAGVGGGGGGGAPGFNIGVGLLGRLGERNGLRFDVTYMRPFSSDTDNVGFTAFTVGYAWIK